MTPRTRIILIITGIFSIVATVLATVYITRQFFTPSSAPLANSNTAASTAVSFPLSQASVSSTSSVAPISSLPRSSSPDTTSPSSTVAPSLPAKKTYTSKLSDHSIPQVYSTNTYYYRAPSPKELAESKTAILYRLSNPANADVRSIVFTSPNTPSELSPLADWRLEKIHEDTFWSPEGCASMPSVFLGKGRYLLTMEQRIFPQPPLEADFDQNFVLFDTFTKKFNYFYENAPEKQQIRSAWHYENDDTVSYYFVPFADIGPEVRDGSFYKKPDSLSGTVTKRTITLSDLSYTDTIEPEGAMPKNNGIDGSPYRQRFGGELSQYSFPHLGEAYYESHNPGEDVVYPVIKNGVLLTRVLSGEDEDINFLFAGSQQIYLDKKDHNAGGAAVQNIFTLVGDTYRRQNLFTGERLVILTLGFFEK
jgi:hypothetical protein